MHLHADDDAQRRIRRSASVRILAKKDDKKEDERWAMMSTNAEGWRQWDQYKVNHLDHGEMKQRWTMKMQAVPYLNASKEYYPFSVRATLIIIDIINSIICYRLSATRNSSWWNSSIFGLDQRELCLQTRFNLKVTMKPVDIVWTHLSEVISVDWTVFIWTDWTKLNCVPY